MLPSRYRLSKKDFIRILRRGIRSQSGGIQFISMQTEASYAHLGILVTKKYSKKAVERNWIKKRIAMAFLPYLKAETISTDIVCKIMQPMREDTVKNIHTTIQNFITSRL